jgi:stearoyl-CoA desaturase (delta-9 desaturase)
MNDPKIRQTEHVPSPNDDTFEDIMYPSSTAFILVHLACFGALWSGITLQALVMCVVLYWARIFAIGAGYHRYFSHRSYSTSRWFQLLLAVACQSTGQKSVLWWAQKHRHHHMYSDTEFDVHSPRHKGFIYSHFLWIFSHRHDGTDLVKISDFARYPELMWLHRYEVVPAVALGVICFVFGGWAGLFVGFFWSTVLVYHSTFCINSLAHVLGRKRYLTGDDSRNNWLLAIFTMGEGWHNNHHAYQSSVRQGFKWWEYDPTFYILKAFSLVGIVWDLKYPPATVVRNEHRLGSRIIRRAAAQLAESFNPDGLVVAVSAALDRTTLATLLEKMSTTQQRAANVLASLHLPQLPTRDEIGSRARAMFAKTSSMDEIVDAAYLLLLDTIGARLCFATLSENGR